MKKNNYKKGLSIIEVIISISILSLVIVTAATFQKDVFSLNSNLQSGLNVQLDARHLVKNMVTELRKTTQAGNGSYSIEAASSTAIIFYSDINNDGLIDRVRYFVSGNNIKKGVIVPTGGGSVYTGSESISTLIGSVVSSSTQPVFQYYPSSYTGTTSPLTSPVSVSSIRLVKITVIIDTDPNKSPVPITVTSSVSLRNLKDNL